MRSTAWRSDSGARRRRQLGVTEAPRSVRLRGRLERPDERRLAAERDLDVGPPGQLEDGPRVDRDLARLDVARHAGRGDDSASGEATAYSSARLSSIPVSTSRMSGVRSVMRPMLAERLERPRDDLVAASVRRRR